jgi:hypothetical protein
MRDAMKHIHVLERDAALVQVTRDPEPEDYALNLTVVYHDARTQAWAREAYDRVTKVAGKEWVRATWWKVSDLVEPGVLAGAVSTAMRAQVVVVAIDAAEGLPFPFHVWVDTWLPHRSHSAGCLYALIGRSEPRAAHAERVREYLREVARMGGFEFLLEERRFPAQPVASPRVPSKTPENHASVSRARILATASRA